MKSKYLAIICALIVSLGCTITLFSADPTPVPTPTFTPTPTATVAIPEDNGGGQPIEPPPPGPTEIYTLTPFPTLPPPPTATPVPPTEAAPYEVTAVLIKNANCRVGPSQDFDTYTSFYAGDVLEVVGRNPDFNNTWWMVIIPGTRVTCWISFVTAQVSGNFDDLPIIYPPY